MVYYTLLGIINLTEVVQPAEVGVLTRSQDQETGEQDSDGRASSTESKACFNVNIRS